MEKSLFDNGFFEFIQTEEEFLIDGKLKTVKRNMVRRPPGIRALVTDQQNHKILLSREFRYELNGWDYRLPGGKVFDSLDDYKKSILEDTVLDHVEQTVPKEVMEEVGLIVKIPKLLKVSHDGAGVIWDLYYYEITDYEISKDGPKLEQDEVIDGFVWKSYDEIIDLCIQREIHEERTVGVLLPYVLEKKKK